MSEIPGLDPGIRRLVTLLREHGFKTTDSGDGVSKPADERALDVPHVFIRCASGEHAIEEAQRLADLLASKRVEIDQDDVSLQATWSPFDGVAMVILTGVSDAHVPEAS